MVVWGRTHGWCSSRLACLELEVGLRGFLSGCHFDLCLGVGEC